MITIQKLMKLVIQRGIVPNLDLDLIFKKMKICGVLEKLIKTVSQDVLMLFILLKKNQHV